MVRRRVALGGVGAAWKPALDQVWEFLRNQRPDLRGEGHHNVFLYHHPASRELPMEVEFGVEVTQVFEAAGEVYATETPAGEVAVVVHVGSYDGIREAHEAIHRWKGSSGRVFAGKSWEIYGDWNEDPAKLETTIVYLLG